MIFMKLPKSLKFLPDNETDQLEIVTNSQQQSVSVVCDSGESNGTAFYVARNRIWF